MAKGPSPAMSRDPRLRAIPAGVPVVTSSGPGRAVSYTGRAPAARVVSMTRYSGHTNPLARR